MPSPLPSFDFVAGESRGARLARIVSFYVGCSLSNRRAELGALVARGVDEAERVVGIKTNCATFSLGVLAAAFGSVAAARAAHPLLATPYRSGQAFVWLMKIGNDWGAWTKPRPGLSLPAGACMHYGTAGTNDDHAEWMLDPPQRHGGGGRPNNAVTSGQSDPRWNAGRPLIAWIDPERVPINLQAASQEQFVASDPLRDGSTLHYEGAAPHSFDDAPGRAEHGRWYRRGNQVVIVGAFSRSGE
jgi:hypothetical protein